VPVVFFGTGRAKPHVPWTSRRQNKMGARNTEAASAEDGESRARGRNLRSFIRRSLHDRPLSTLRSGGEKDQAKGVLSWPPFRKRHSPPDETPPPSTRGDSTSGPRRSSPSGAGPSCRLEIGPPPSPVVNRRGLRGADRAIPLRPPARRHDDGIEAIQPAARSAGLPPDTTLGVGDDAVVSDDNHRDGGHAKSRYPLDE